jgi:RNA polymerase sigma-70 factor (ECF subfamily)
VSGPLPEPELVLLYRQTIRPLYAYVSRRVGGDAGLAEDLVQDVWMRALDDWARKGLPRDPLAWLLRVAHNTLISHFRKRRPEPIDPASIDIADERFSPVTAETAAVVGWGLAQLSRSHADLLEAFYFDGQTVEEIARQRSMSARAVEGRLRRAREKLRKTLGRVLRRPVDVPYAMRKEG